MIKNVRTALCNDRIYEFEIGKKYEYVYSEETGFSIVFQIGGIEENGYYITERDFSRCFVDIGKLRNSKINIILSHEKG